MKRFLQKRKRKGFTLVELLIVIIIIGILAGSMLLVMGSGKDKAEATKIVSNLRSLKAAGLMYYADTDSWPVSGDSLTALDSTLDTYMDAEVTDNYKAISKDVLDRHIWIGLDLSGEGVDAGVVEKLVAFQKANGSVIFGGNGTSPASTDIATYVWMPLN